MSHATDHAEHEEGYFPHHHITPTKFYLGILMALFALTGLTVLAYNVHLGELNLLVAVLIASMKATLVCTWFMHLKYDNPFNVLIMVGSLIFVGIFFTYVMNDTSHRGRANVVSGRSVDFTGRRATTTRDYGLNEADYQQLVWPEGYGPVAVQPEIVDDLVTEEASIAPVAPLPYQLRLQRVVEGEDVSLKILGAVPSEADREALAGAGQAYFSSVDTSEVRLDPTVSLPEIIASVERGAQGLSLLQRGRVDFKRGNILELSGEADAATLEQVRGLFSEIPGGYSFEPRLLDFAEAERCDAALRGILQTKIQFETGSAQISEASNAIIDRLFAAAGQCPDTVRIRVDGHTDNTGDENGNQLLSEQRAEAVVAALMSRGLPAERLEAHGFGASQPIADNSTEEGQAQNRRISIHLDRVTE